jgi:phage gpG-like protein
MELTVEQKQIINENSSSISDLTELTRLAFPDAEKIDGRSKQGRAVRDFLLSNEIEYETKHIYPKEDVDLTKEQKEFIDQSVSSGMTCSQVASVLFPEMRVTHNSKEYQAVFDYVDKNENIQTPASEDAINRKYSPPKATSKIIKKINDYAQTSINEDKMTIVERRGVESLGNFLASPRFIQIINNYDSQADRDLFEAEFVRATWDKPDLTSDEINLYINVCIDYIHLKNIQSAINKLNRMFDEAEDQQDLTVRLAELLKTKSEEYNQCEKRMESLIQKLQGDRSKRISSKQQQNSNILALVQLFQEEEERKVMIKIAEMQKQVAREEADNLESMPDWKARVLGISKEDVI